MKLVRFFHNDIIQSGVLDGDQITVDMPGSSQEIISLHEVKLTCPVVPSKIVCVGLNYTDHAIELGMDIPDEPIIFLKPPTCLIGPGEDIVYPSSSQRVDYEAELGIVIGKTAKNVSKNEAGNYILGYTCVNDVTARDLQRKDGQWTRAKSFDTFAPIGPWVETDLDPNDVNIKLYLNDVVKQESRTSGFIFRVSELISFISNIMTLLPGDVITTGTPSGVGAMQRGDMVTVEIEGVGKLQNQVV
jgi:2-keto-4-pentenoate hydratase/2-oxohepta-3-ene-1,7-dioic acid hydratase in catechol pathway